MKKTPIIHILDFYIRINGAHVIVYPTPFSLYHIVLASFAS